MSTPWVFDVYLAIAIIKLERNTLNSDIETTSFESIFCSRNSSFGRLKFSMDMLLFISEDCRVVGMNSMSLMMVQL